MQKYLPILGTDRVCTSDDNDHHHDGGHDDDGEDDDGEDVDDDDNGDGDDSYNVMIVKMVMIVMVRRMMTKEEYRWENRPSRLWLFLTHLLIGSIPHISHFFSTTAF